MLDVVPFGEVLWDVIEGEAHIGGAPCNLAAHAVCCGLRAAVLSRVGDDSLGRGALAEMARLGVDARWVGMDSEHPTGTVTVSLADGQPSYAIHEQVAWDFVDVEDGALGTLAVEKPRAFCFGTLAQRGEVSRQTLAKLLSLFGDAVVFYDVNLRQHYWSAERVAAGLALATLVKVNEDEASVLGGLLFDGACTPEAFGRALLSRYPSRAVVVTCGAKGCWVCERGAAPVACACEPVKVVDTVGAGDAFSAAFLAAWLRGATAADAAAAGNARGAWVASQPGAVPEGDPGI